MALGDDFKVRCHKQRQKEEKYNAQQRREKEAYYGGTGEVSPRETETTQQSTEVSTR